MRKVLCDPVANRPHTDVLAEKEECYEKIHDSQHNSTYFAQVKLIVITTTQVTLQRCFYEPIEMDTLPSLTSNFALSCTRPTHLFRM